jgi:hypothetical protein
VSGHVTVTTLSTHYNSRLGTSDTNANLKLYTHPSLWPNGNYILTTYLCVFPHPNSSIRHPGSLRDRSTLLGVTPPASGRSSPFNNDHTPQGNGHRFADDLEGQNDEALDGLSAKVKLLKDVSESQIFSHLYQLVFGASCRLLLESVMR